MNNTNSTINDDLQTQKFNTVDFVTANVKIHDALILLQTVNYDVVETLLSNTPDEIKQTKSCLILQAAKDFYAKVVEISSRQDSPADLNQPLA